MHHRNPQCESEMDLQTACLNGYGFRQDCRFRIPGQTDEMPNGRCRMHGGITSLLKHGRRSNRSRHKQKAVRSLLLTMGSDLHSLIQ